MASRPGGRLVDTKPLSEHHFTATGLISRWAPYCLLSGVLGVLACGLLVMGVARPRSGTLLPGLLFGAAAIGFAVPVVMAFFRRTQRVLVFPDKLAWQDTGGGRHLGWDEVESVHRFERITNKWWYQTKLTITWKNGEKAVFDHSLSNFSGLADR